MTESNETLGQFLRRRRREMSDTEGRFELLSWRELASRCILPDGRTVPESNLLRWSKDSGTPSSFDYVYSIARVFGPETFSILGMDISPALAYLWANRRDPNVAEVIEEARAAAEARRIGGDNPLTRTFAFVR